MKTDLSIYNNSEYNPGSYLKRGLWYLFSIAFINTYFPIPVFFKIWILKLFGAKIGKSVMIKPMVNIKYPWFLEVGDFTWIGEDVWIDNLCNVQIGEHACLSQGAMLLTGNHDYSLPEFNLKIEK